MPERSVGPWTVQYRPLGDGLGEVEITRDGDERPKVLDRARLTSARRRSQILSDLPEEARDAVGEALLELAQASPDGRRGPTGPEVLRADREELIHPTFALRDDFLLYGFRVERPTPEGGVEEVPVRVLSVDTGDGLELRVPEEGDAFEVGDRRYVVDPRWRPPLLDDRWSREGLHVLLTGGPGSEPPVPGAVYLKVRKVLHRHLDFADDGAYPVLAAFVLLTYVARAFPAVPYVGLLGPKGTGKSQTLAVLERLCFNAYKGRVTAAGLGDTTSALRGTVLVDQAQRLPEELIDLLVDGYRRDGGRRRVVDVDNRGRPWEFETFGPKAVASAKGIDPDLVDRLVVIHTAPATRPVRPLPASEDEFRRLRGALYASALEYWPLYADAAAEMEGEALHTRSEELWRPLRAVLDVTSAPSDDVEAARELYRRSAVETVAELGDWELALLDDLDARFDARTSDVLELVNTELLAGVHRRLGMGKEDHDGPRPGARWLGSALDRLNLLDGKERRRVEGKRRRVYRFTRNRVEGQTQRFGVPTSRPSQPTPESSGRGEAVGGKGSEPPSRRPDQIGSPGAEGAEGEQDDEELPDLFSGLDDALDGEEVR